MKYTKQKIVISILMIMLFAMEPISALALFGGASKARGDINDFLENDLNINVEESLKPITEGINSSDRKVKTSKVSLRFSTPNPKPNEKLTVSADVEGLANIQDAYYTWFLKRAGDSYDDADKLHKNAIKAQALIYHDPEMFNQTFNQGIKEGKTDDDSYTVKMGGDNGNGEEGYCYIYDTKDGKQYELAEAGESESGCEEGFVPRCMMEKRELQCPVIVGGLESETETETETSGSSSTSTTVTTIEGLGGQRSSTLTQCIDTGIRATCNENTRQLYCKSNGSNAFSSEENYKCKNGECEESSCDPEEDDDCTKGGEMMSINYDYDSEDPVNIPTPFCIKKDKSTGQVWSDPNLNGCPSDGGSGGTCKVTIDGEEGESIGNTNGNRPSYLFSKTGGQYCGGAGGMCEVKITGCTLPDGQKDTYTFSNPGDPAGPVSDTGGEGSYSEGEFAFWSKSESNGKLAILLPSNLSSDGGSGCKNNEENVQKPKECRIGETKNNKCGPDTHLFSAEDVADMSEEIEEQYGTNPIDSRTTQLAKNDGALIAGLGVKDFTWKYQEGDEITVIVEGQGMATTKHENASYQTVFAMPAPGCKALEDAKENSGKYGETIKKKVIEIETVELDLKECLSEELFSKPGTSEYDALDVNVSSGSSSASSASTPSGVGKEMKITAHAGQTQGGSISNSNHLYYEWEMKCEGSNKNLLTDASFKDNVTSKTKGMNIPNLTFIADFPSEGSTNCFPNGKTGTVTVNTKINEPRAGGGSNFGQNTTTFKIFNVADNPIKVYKTKVVQTTKFQKTNTEICADGLDKTICRVLNNEVIAVVATCDDNSQANCTNGIYNGEMISWKVNGRNYTCDESVSPDCSNQSNTGILLLPTNGLGGDAISITAQISDVNKDTNQSQSIMRMFKVTEPELFIVPVAGASWKVLGTYEDLDDNKFLDESTSALETMEGETITLKADIYPSFVNKQQNLKYEWFINGELYDTNEIMSFVPDGDVSVSVKATHTLEKKDRKALRDSFGITQSQTTPQNLTANIKITTNKDPQTQTAGIKGFFATTQHNAPEYFLFLLKMTLIVGIMLFIPSLVIGFSVKE